MSSPHAPGTIRSRWLATRSLWTHTKGGFYHDGRFPDLPAVLEHYNRFFKLSFTDQEKRDLIEYLKAL